MASQALDNRHAQKSCNHTGNESPGLGCGYGRGNAELQDSQQRGSHRQIGKPLLDTALIRKASGGGTYPGRTESGNTSSLGTTSRRRS